MVGKWSRGPLGAVTGELSRLVATADYERLRSSLQSAFEEADVILWNESVHISFLNFQILLRSRRRSL